MSDQPDEALAAAAARHLRALAAAPRFTGSEAAARAREYCSRELSALGYAVADEPFEYSSFVGRYASPLAGAWSAAAILLATTLELRGRAAAPLVVLLLSLAFLGVSSVWATRRGVLTAPVLRARGVNLIARPRDANAPTVWLVAHVDSKSQSVPMLLRIASVVLLATSWLVLLVLAAIALRAQVRDLAWLLVGAAGMVGSLGVAATLVGNVSPGAIDNASGMATVLLAASLLEHEPRVGVIVTDAEELGLAGARALTRTWPSTRTIALNVDGVDDEGALLVMKHGARSAAPAEAMRRAFTREAGERGTATLAVRRTIPGVLVDSIAFVDAGWQSVTLSRGTARTLRRIHTRADGLEQLRGVGIPLTARVLAAAARELT